MIKLVTELDSVDEDGCTALMKASTEGKIEMVKLLHGAKADLNVCDRYGTALHRAVINGHTEVLKVTLNERIISICTGLVGQAITPFTITSRLVVSLALVLL